MANRCTVLKGTYKGFDYKIMKVYGLGYMPQIKLGKAYKDIAKGLVGYEEAISTISNWIEEA